MSRKKLHFLSWMLSVRINIPADILEAVASRASVGMVSQTWLNILVGIMSVLTKSTVSTQSTLAVRNETILCVGLRL